MRVPGGRAAKVTETRGDRAIVHSFVRVGGQHEKEENKGELLE